MSDNEAQSVDVLNRHLASIGAIITILALGIDPTVQQMISVKAEQVNSTASTATISRAQSFLRFGSAESPTVQNQLPTVDMIGAFFTGMFSGFDETQELTLDVPSSCSTGNCTFPTFQSLAVCSNCQDITHTIQATYNTSGSFDWTYSLPNGLNVTHTSTMNIYGAFASSGSLSLVNDPGIGNGILNFTRVRGVVTDIDGDILQNATASQCLLYWCVNTYGALIDNGRLDERAISSWHSNKTELWTGWRAKSVNNGYRLDLVPPVMAEQYTDNRNFTVSNMATVALSSWLAGKSTVDNMSGDSSSDWADMLRVFRDSNSSMLFSRIAKSMTRNVRSANSSSQTTDVRLYPFMNNITGVGPANGTAHSLEVHVSVRWPWLIFSAMLVAMAIALLLATLIDTAKRDIAHWTTSPTPILLQALEESKSNRQILGTDVIAMEKMAHEIEVYLGDADSGFRLLRSEVEMARPRLS